MVRNYFKKLPFPFWYLLVGAGFVSIVVVSQSYIAEVFASRKTGEIMWSPLMVAVPFVNYFFWVILTPIIYSLSKRIEFTKPRWRKTFGTVLFWGFLLSSFHEFVTSMLYYVPKKIIFEGLPFKELFVHLNAQYFVFAISTRVLEFLGIFLFFIGLNYYRRYVESRLNLERVKNELHEAQFRALKMQLHPHFLFNTLNSISSLIDEDSKLAQRMVAQLGNLLRKILDHGQKTEVTLEEELRFIKDYLSIEQVRFVDRLKVEYDIQEVTLSCMVPNLILQPLVENSIKHGFAKKSNGCTISIASTMTDGYLTMKVSDNGLGPKSGSSSDGVGLTNVKERLQKYYDGDASLTKSSPDSGGFEVTLKMKIHD
jgi:two-component system LytT family sensor kinase